MGLFMVPLFPSITCSSQASHDADTPHVLLSSWLCRCWPGHGAAVWAGLSAVPGRTQVLESRPGGWKENLIGLGGREQGAGDIQDVSPATAENPKLLFLQPQAQFCALSCPKVLAFRLVRNPPSTAPIPIQPSIPLHAHSLVSKIQVWWG